LLLECNDVLVIAILRKLAAFATVFLLGLIGYKPACTQQLVSFVIMGVDGNLQHFHCSDPNSIKLSL
jgi:hypothetical protein